MNAQNNDTESVINRFNEAFNGHDVDGVMALMTDDCRFETTGPSPDGQAHVGQAAVRTCWEDLFGGNPDATFSTEEMFVAGDRCVVRWRYDWDKEDMFAGSMYSKFAMGKSPRNSVTSRVDSV